MIRIFICFCIILLARLNSWAQSFPITTTSNEARAIFLNYGWDNAFNFQDALHLETMDKLISMDSSFVLAYLHRGGYSPLHIRKKYFELAKEKKDLITPDERKLVDAFYAFMWDYDQLKAVQILQELADKYPNQPHFPAYIGIRYGNMGEYAKAIPFFEEALRRDPDFAPAYQRLGSMYLRLKQYNLAEKNFQIFKQKEPGLWRGPYNLGYLYLLQDKLSEAEEYFKMAIEMDSSAEARDIIAYDYLLKGNTAKSKEMLEENLVFHPNDPNSYSSMGDWFFEQNEFKKAAEWYKKSLEYIPLNTAARDYYNNLVEAEIQDAHKTLKEAIQNHDIKQLSQLITFNASIFTFNGNSIQGASKIIETLNEFLKKGNYELDLQVRRIISSKNEFFATEIGRFTVKSNNTKSTKGDYTSIWRLTSDGWKICNLMYIKGAEE